LDQSSRPSHFSDRYPNHSMKTRIVSLCLFGLVAALPLTAQPFQLGTSGPNVQVGGFAAFDGTNYLVGFQEYSSSQGGSIGAELFSKTGTAVVPYLSTGATGGMGMVAFDGTNYLMVWGDDATQGISGCFINKSGAIVGARFPISDQGAHGNCGVVYGGGQYLVWWSPQNGTTANGRFVPASLAQSGVLSTTSFAVNPSGSTAVPVGMGVAFDGTNFLVAWESQLSSTSYEVDGRFMTPAGSMGTPFAISQAAGASATDYISIAYDGSLDYLVVWDSNASSGSSIYARTVAKNGTFPGSKFTVASTGAGNQFFGPGAASDGTNFLVTWATYLANGSSNVYAQFFNPAGVSQGAAIAPFTANGANQPEFAAPLFDGSRFLLVGFVGTSTETGDHFISGATYGTFLPGTGPAEITTQPANRVVPAGESTSFSVTVSGTAPLSFQWQRNGVDLVDGDGVSGATSSTLTLSNVQPGDAGSYTVVIGSPAGTVTSPAATLVMSPVYVFTTLAGTGPQAGSTDGVGTAARFSNPGGVAWDAAGNLYVTDGGNYISTIRKITPAGVVTTLAGLAGNSGSADGTGTAARFGGINGAATDGAGNLYVADNGNSTIRKITPAGVVTTLAGLAGNSGSADGTGSDARFNDPDGVAADLSGNFYVADNGNSTIRKITPAGVVTTLAGLAGNSGSADGTGSDARFYEPGGVAVDLSGNLYVADQRNSTIRKVTPAGVVTTLAGLAGSNGSADGTGTGARFNWPRGVAVDLSGNLYVADESNCMIRKVTPAGVVTTLAGLAGSGGDADGLGAAARFAFLGLVSVNAGGTVAVADTTNNTIRTITPAGLVTTLAGSSGGSIGSTDGPGSTARFFGPTGAVLDAENNLYVVDTDNHKIRKITPAGVVSTIAVLTGSSSSNSFPAPFGPSGIARDGAGNLYVTDKGNGRVLKITSAGEVTTFASVVDGGDNSLTGIVVDSNGNVFVADTWNHTIRKITPTGEVSVFAGQMWNAGYADGVGVNAQFCGPSGLVLDGADNLYVADTWNHVIRKITPAGVVSTVSGVVRTWGGGDGPDTVEAATRFSYPTGLARDDAGNLYVTEFYELNRIWRVTPDGMVSWIAGRIPGCADGVGTAARFNLPSSIVVDTSGNLYVTDFGNNTIRKGVPITPMILAQTASQTVFAGNSATFDVTTAGVVTGYEWQVSTDGGSTWSNLSDSGLYTGSATASLTVSGVTAGMSGYQYRCQVSGGSSPIVTTASTLTTVNAASGGTVVAWGDNRLWTNDRAGRFERGDGDCGG
jgi:hypothetical protein